MGGCCLYLEAIAELRSHVAMKISSWCFFCRSEAPACSLQAQLCAGEGTPSLFPVPAERGQGLPHPQLQKWHRPPPTSHLARIFHELLSRDHEDGRANWQPQGVGSEAYLNGTSQGPTPEDARKGVHIRGRSR
jgi:hypothetical protein